MANVHLHIGLHVGKTYECKICRFVSLKILSESICKFLCKQICAKFKRYVCDNIYYLYIEACLLIQPTSFNGEEASVQLILNLTSVLGYSQEFFNFSVLWG